MANFEAGMSFDLDIYELYNDNEFMKQWPNFKDEIYENPTNTLNCIKLGIHQVLLLLLNIILNYACMLHVCLLPHARACAHTLHVYRFFVTNFLLLLLTCSVHHHKLSLHLSKNLYFCANLFIYLFLLNSYFCCLNHLTGNRVQNNINAGLGSNALL